MFNRSFFTLAGALVAAVGLLAYAVSAETAVGALRGRVIAEDTGQPLVGVRVGVRPTTPLSGSDTFNTETDKDGAFRIARLPVGTYEVLTATNVYENKPAKATVREGEAAEVPLKLKPGNPFLRLHVHRHSNLPGADPRIAVQGFRQGDDLRLRLMTIDPATLMREHGQHLRRLLTPVSTTSRPGAFGSLAGKVKTVREWTHRIRSRDAEGAFYDYIKLGTIPQGVYLVTARGAQDEGLGWLMVTDLGLVTKSSAGQVIAFTANLKTGAVVPGAQVTLYRDATQVARATTNGQGLATIRLGQGGGETAAVARVGSSIAFMHFYADGGGDRRRYRVFTYTDRPVYRPGHRVRFKGVVRAPQGKGYAVPSPRSVELTVKDGLDTTLEELDLRLNDRGSYAGEFRLSPEAQAGLYTLRVRIDGEEHVNEFAVASYRKPEWRVDVSTPKPRYVRGERIPVTVRSEYYYGSPVVQGKVRYTIYRSEYFSWYSEDDEYAPEEGEEGYADSGEVVDSGERTTDADGTVELSIDTSQAPDSGSASGYLYTVEAEVSDPSDRAVTGKGTVRVMAGELTLDARPEKWMVQPGETVAVRVRARDLNDHPAAGVDVKVSAAQSVWNGKTSVEKPLTSATVKTDASGTLQFTFQAQDTGSVSVKAEARDRRGNKVEASADVWVSTAEGGDYPVSYSSLAVVPDKKAYRIGEVAQMLVNTPHLGGASLVSVEAEEVLDLKVVPLKTRSTVVRFPIREGYEPNVFLTVSQVVNQQFLTHQVTLNVNADSHRLNVAIESDRPLYHPGDTATFRVRTTNQKGQPVPAELSFGVVDEAVYAIREEPSRGLWETFYPRRYNGVATEFSFPQIYLGDADKDGGNVAIRKNFPDTAHWDPFLRTDGSGLATVTVVLPDSLTSWRATAQAHTPGTEIGKATYNVRVAKELTLRLQTPRTFTEGDELTLSAVAHNYTPAAMEATVDLRATGLTVKGDTRRRVRIQPGQAERITWEAVASTPGTAVVTATATGGAFSDGMQLSVPVRPFARKSVVFRTGAVTGEAATEEFPLENGAIGGTAEVRVSPSLAGTVLGSLEYLVQYPYGCTEQTMSSFLPAVVVSRTLGELGLRRPEIQNRLPEITQAGLLRLYRYQHEDGGWGWWEYDGSDPWMTAYVLSGLTLAKEGGTRLNDNIYQSALLAAREQSQKIEIPADRQQFLAYALARAGSMDHARKALARTEKDVEKLQRRSLGYRALALAAAGGSERERGASLMQYLWSIAEEAGGLVHWSEKRKGAYYDVPQDVESTAVILQAALKLTPRDPRLPGVVRWLLLERRGNQWQSTRDTAFILLALTDYLKASGELKPDYRLTVTLNGSPIHSEEVKPDQALGEERVLRVPLKDLQPANRLEVRKEGEGTVYYALQVTQDVRTSGFAPESSIPGLSLKREYFRLETRRDEAGRISVVPEKRPTTSLRTGDRIRVRLTLKTDKTLEYLMLEDPLPAGCEVQDRGDVNRDEWDAWWSHQDVRDDRVALFMRQVTPGEHVLEYHLRPEMTGNVRVLPAVVSDMYVPSTRASTGDLRLELGR